MKYAYFNPTVFAVEDVPPELFVQFENIKMAEECMKSSITLQKRKLQLSFSSRDSIECDKFSSKQTPGPVILATITCIKYPVTAEVIFSIFNRFGEVLKTIIFSKI